MLVLIVLLLLSIFIPFIRKTRESEHRVRCQSNLRALGKAFQDYAKANAGAFPRVVYDAVNQPSGYFAFTGPYAPNPFGGDGRVSANDVTASLWLLVRGGYASPALFICPSSSDYADPLTDATGKDVAPNDRSNFKRARNLSYSYASPFSAAPGYKFDRVFAVRLRAAGGQEPGQVLGERRDGAGVQRAAARAGEGELAESRPGGTEHVVRGHARGVSAEPV